MAGLMRVNVKPASWREWPEVRWEIPEPFRKCAQKGENVKEKSGSGKEEPLRTSVKANGIEAISV